MSKIILKNVRISFPSLYKKGSFNGEETKFEATFLLNKEEHADSIADIKAQIAELVKTNLKGAKIAADKLCLRDGDDVEYDGYAGCYSIKCSTKKRPIVIDRDRSPLTEDDGKPYGGCYVNASIDLWVQNNAYGKRVNSTLLAVQFFKDGEPFSDGSTGDINDFDLFSDDDDMFA
jgi:hypothetical protein